MFIYLDFVNQIMSNKSQVNTSNHLDEQHVTQHVSTRSNNNI